MGELKIGVVDQVPVRTGGTAEQAVRESLELARAAERLGFHRYWLAEHHSTNSFACAAPEVLIGQVAAATREIRVGSGGVLLSHYSPFKVAEQFRMLEALFPGRVDLGVGRAPGGDHRSVGALLYGRPPIPIESYPQQVEDLVAWLEETFPGGHPWGRVRAVPRVSTAPPVWLLGSGGSSARLAAARGHGYAFAQFISGEDGAGLMHAYRETFRPSARFPQPAGIVAVGVICAETSDEAHHLAASLEAWRRRIMSGRDRGIPHPDEALAELGGMREPRGMGVDGARVIAGDPAEVRDELHRIAGRYGVDEVLVVTVVHDFAARLRSHELLAEAMGLAARG